MTETYGGMIGQKKLSLTPGKNQDRLLKELRQVKDTKQVRGMDNQLLNDVELYSVIKKVRKIIWKEKNNLGCFKLIFIAILYFKLSLPSTVRNTL